MPEPGWPPVFICAMTLKYALAFASVAMVLWAIASVVSGGAIAQEIWAVAMLMMVAWLVVTDFLPDCQWLWLKKMPRPEKYVKMTSFFGAANMPFITAVAFAGLLSKPVLATGDYLFMAAAAVYTIYSMVVQVHFGGLFALFDKPDTFSEKKKYEINETSTSLNYVQQLAIATIILCSVVMPNINMVVNYALPVVACVILGGMSLHCEFFIHATHLRIELVRSARSKDSDQDQDH